ncbi:hypothetical protein J6590_103416 [Homalodisca vitripennis]|nr:hypothetical protein J6590_103416 [Homalodisca vitripennis]
MKETIGQFVGVQASMTNSQHRRSHRCLHLNEISQQDKQVVVYISAEDADQDCFTTAYTTTRLGCQARPNYLSGRMSHGSMVASSLSNYELIIIIAAFHFGVEFRGEDLHGTSQAYNNGDLDRPTGTGLDSESHISAGSPPVPANDLFVQLRFLYSYIVVDSNCNAILPCIQITTAVTVY